MITAIRAVRLARGLTLEDVARRCVPPTTAQTISRLETGTRTISVPWLNRIAASLQATTADLVTFAPDDALAVAALLDATGAHAPRRALRSPAPQPEAGTLALRVEGSVGDYRAGDVLWCMRLAPAAFAQALNRDVLVPRPAGRFAFGRLVARDAQRLHLLPPAAGARQQVIDTPPWLARVVRLIREF